MIRAACRHFMPGFLSVVTQRVSEDVLNVYRVDFAGVVVKSVATRIQYHNVGDVALVVLFD